MSAVPSSLSCQATNYNRNEFSNEPYYKTFSRNIPQTCYSVEFIFVYFVKYDVNEFKVYKQKIRVLSTPLLSGIHTETLVRFTGLINITNVQWTNESLSLSLSLSLSSLSLCVCVGGGFVGLLIYLINLNQFDNCVSF